MYLLKSLEFLWDKGNQNKNFVKHGVSNEEIEEACFDNDKRIFRDILHSESEDRYLLIGETLAKRKLFIVFTLRDNKIRIISARNLNRREASLYYEKGNKITKI